MAFNGSGTYVLPSGNPVVTGTTISSTWANTTLSDIATALTNCITRDGQSTPTANIPMGNFKLTGLGQAASTGDALAWGKNASVVDFAASGTVSGTGFSNYLASPPAIGGTTPAAISGTTITASVQFSGPVNGTIGATTPNTGAFTTLSASSTVSGVGFSNYLASPPAIGGTAAAAGSFTTLSASSTVSGTGFTNWLSSQLASPPSIGGTTPGTGAFSTLSATGNVSFTSTGYMLVPVGTTAQRPTGASGYLRFNSSSSAFEGYNGTSWGSLGGATGGGVDQVFYLNGKTVSTTYSIPSNQNAHSVGPITVSSGVTVTIPSGSRWVIS